jgi:hypothetical protein
MRLVARMHFLYASPISAVRADGEPAEKRAPRLTAPAVKRLAPIVRLKNRSAVEKGVCRPTPPVVIRLVIIVTRNNPFAVVMSSQAAAMRKARLAVKAATYPARMMNSVVVKLPQSIVTQPVQLAVIARVVIALMTRRVAGTTAAQAEQTTTSVALAQRMSLFVAVNMQLAVMDGVKCPLSSNEQCSADAGLGCSEGATCASEFGYCNLPYVEFDYNYIPEVGPELHLTNIR